MWWWWWWWYTVTDSFFHLLCMPSSLDEVVLIALWLRAPVSSYLYSPLRALELADMVAPALRKGSAYATGTRRTYLLSDCSQKNCTRGFDGNFNENVLVWSDNLMKFVIFFELNAQTVKYKTYILGECVYLCHIILLPLKIIYRRI